ncbi:MAG: NUDIX hydrolase [Candidatus Pacearchaeota archaeon]
MVKPGVSAIIYDDNGKLFFLIFRRVKNWRGWEFCKGKAEDGESIEEALAREISEETGLTKAKLIQKIGTRIIQDGDSKYPFEVFLVEASMNVPIKIKKAEHDTYLWADEETALDKLTWDNERNELKKAMAIIKKNKD